MTSMERISPHDLKEGEATGTETLVIHLARYDFAAHHVRPGRLLDIACGVGYGTHMLASRNPDNVCVGVDRDADAIAEARRHYSRPNVSYVVADAMTFVDPAGFDTIASLETIEHLPQPMAFVKHVVSQLRPGGRFIASVPTTPSVDANPHHLHDFTEGSFRAMFSMHGLREVACLRIAQPYRPLPLLTRQEARAEGLRRNIAAFYVSNPMSLAKRIATTIRYGFENRYLTAAFEKPRR